MVTAKDVEPEQVPMEMVAFTADPEKSQNKNEHQQQPYHSGELDWSS